MSSISLIFYEAISNLIICFTWNLPFVHLCDIWIIRSVFVSFSSVEPTLSNNELFYQVGIVASTNGVYN